MYWQLRAFSARNEVNGTSILIQLFKELFPHIQLLHDMNEVLNKNHVE